ncbi:AMP-binding protein [Desulfocastanea catecholica]
MPRDEIVREITLGQILAETVAKYPHETAVAYAEREYRQTWQEFSDTVDTMAKGLMAMGIQKGEKVAVWATNVPHWVALQFATARIGAILLTINTNYRSAEIDYVLKQSDCENIFIINGLRDANYLEILYGLIPELKTHPRGDLHASGYPCLKRVFFLGPEKHRGLYSMSEVMSLAVATDDAEYRQRQDSLSPHDVINMQYTSGTTGFPKGVMLTHINIGNNGYWLGAGQNFSHLDRICIPVPLFHCFGCVLGVMACVNHGATMVFVETFDPVDVMMSIEMEKCTGVYGVPTMFMAMLDHKLFKKFDFSSLRTGIMAGSPCPVKTMNDCIEKMHMTEVTIVFGLTEASPGMTQTMYNEPSIQKKCETVGKAMPGIEVKIVDPKTGALLPPGQPGEVMCRGYNIMKGYYKMEKATAEAIDKDGFLHSGDIGVMDEDGYFAITGRIKDMIIRGGENIYPKEIEDFLHHMDGVKDVQVVGVPSKKYGEQPGAFVIPYPDADISPQDIIDFCQGKIAWFKTPKFVHFLNEFPLTASGKVMKIKLREQSAELWPNA